MRLLFISNLYPPHYIGGYELHCAQVADAMRAKGHEVEVLTSDHRVKGKEGLTDEPHVHRELRVHGHFGHPWLGINPLSELEQHNNQVLRKTLKRYQPEGVYVWNMGGISKSLLHTLARADVPTAHYVSDHWVASSLKADVWLSWWNRSNMSKAAKLLRRGSEMFGVRKRWDAMAPTGAVESIPFRNVVFCSKAMRRITEKNGYDVGHGEIIHCPVNTTRFTGEASAAERPVQKLLFVGRFAPDKGVKTALEAMRLIKGQFEGELCLYGKGEPSYETELREYAIKHELPVSFHSAEPSEMPQVYASHDALLFTSEWEEPFAITPLEAMASGLPVIGTTTGGSAELFEHGVNALTYEAGNAVMLAHRIIALSENSSLRTSIAKAGQDVVRARCAEHIIMDQAEQYLKSMIATWIPSASSDEAQNEDSMPLNPIPVPLP